MRLIELPKESKGFLDIKRSMSRGEFYKMLGTEPHEKRFEAFNYFPSPSTKAQ